MKKGVIMLPEDPIMLMSMINMKLRDTGKNFEELCEDLDVSAGDVEKKLSDAGFEYNKDVNQFR
jgi:hypothetical protein